MTKCVAVCLLLFAPAIALCQGEQCDLPLLSANSASEPLLSDLILLPHIKPARRQNFGDCAYQAQVRATEYAYEALTGQEIYLSVPYVLMNRLREQAHGASIDLPPPIQISIDKIDPNENPVYTRHEHMERTYGYLPEDAIQVSPAQIIALRDRLRRLVSAYRTRAWILKRLMLKGQLARATERIHREIDVLVDEYGGSKKQLFSIDGSSDTPETFFRDRLTWQHVDIVDSGLKLEGLIRNTLSNRLPLIVSIPDASERYIEERAIFTYPDSRWGKFSGHSMVIVGIGRDRSGEIQIVVQNSWGPTVFGLEGLALIPLDSHKRVPMELYVPIPIGTKSLDQLDDSG